MKSIYFFSKVLVSFLFSIFFFKGGLPLTYAALNEALLTSYQGNVEIFVSGEKAKNLSSFVIFDGQKFGVMKPKIGLKLAEGDLIRTGNDGKMKVIYSNGDVFILGPASALTVPSKKKSDPTKAEAELLYGKVRGLVDKNGPLTKMEIKTRTAVSGIRGTDLVVMFDPVKDYTEVHVIRGEVMVHPKNPDKPELPPTHSSTSLASSSKQTEDQNKKLEASGDNQKSSQENPALQDYVVKSGYKIEVAKVNASSNSQSQGQGAPSGQNQAKVSDIMKTELKPSTQVDLKKINTETTLPKIDIAKATMASAESPEQVQNLEKKALDRLIEEVKKTDQKQYEKLQKKEKVTVEELNSSVVQALETQAPKGSKKPKREDFQFNEEDVYKKFFKVQ